MTLHELNEPVIRQAIEEFYQQASGFVSAVSKVVSNANFSLRRTPRRVGRRTMPYFFGAELWELFEFAKGERQMSRSYVETECQKIMTLLTASIGGGVAPLDWNEFGATPLGLCVLACGARLSLHEEEGHMRGAEVVLLAGVGPELLEEAGLAPVGDDDGHPLFDRAAVRSLFEEKGIPV